MKTLVRIQHFEENGFNFKVIQVLGKKYKDTTNLEGIGIIKFQQTPGEDSWYALSFEVITSEAYKLKKMANLAKHIENNTNFDSQPDDVLKIIGAVEYKLFNNEFYPVSDEGKNLYDVTLLGSVYSRISAKDENEAAKILKENGWDKHGIEFNSVIKF